MPVEHLEAARMIEHDAEQIALARHLQAQAHLALPAAHRRHPRVFMLAGEERGQALAVAIERFAGRPCGDRSGNRDWGCSDRWRLSRRLGHGDNGRRRRWRLTTCGRHNAGRIGRPGSQYVTRGGTLRARCFLPGLRGQRRGRGRRRWRNSWGTHRDEQAQAGDKRRQGRRRNRALPGEESRDGAMQQQGKPEKCSKTTVDRRHLPHSAQRHAHRFSPAKVAVSIAGKR